MANNTVKTSGEGSLKRQLSPMHVWAIAFGCVIGWGSFINPGKKFLFKSGAAGTAIAMVLGALVMIVIAFSYAYMVPKYPKAGGEFTFTKNCFGKTLAFTCGWFLVAAYLTNVPMNSTAIGLIVNNLDGNKDILRFGYLYEIAENKIYIGEILLASGILILFGFLNIIGVKKAGIVQTILASLLVLCVFTLFIAALISAKAKNINLSPVWGFDKDALAEATKKSIDADVTALAKDTYAHKGTSGIMSAILATFAIAPWAYVGFDAIPQAAEEFKFSFKKVSFIMIIAIVFGCFVYVSNNTVAAAVGLHAHVGGDLGAKIVQGSGRRGGSHGLPSITSGFLIFHNPSILTFHGVPGDGSGATVNRSGEVGRGGAGGVHHDIVDGGRSLRTTGGIVAPSEDDVFLTSVGSRDQHILASELVLTIDTGEVVLGKHTSLRSLVEDRNLQIVVLVTHGAAVEAQDHIGSGQVNFHVSVRNGSGRYIIFISKTIRRGDVQLVIVKTGNFADVPLVGVFTVHERPVEIAISFIESAGERQRCGDDVVVVAREELNCAVVDGHETDHRSFVASGEGSFDRLEAVADDEGVSILGEVDVRGGVVVERASGKFAIDHHHQLGNIVCRIG